MDNGGEFFLKVIPNMDCVEFVDHPEGEVMLFLREEATERGDYPGKWVSEWDMYAMLPTGELVRIETFFDMDSAIDGLNEAVKALLRIPLSLVGCIFTSGPEGHFILETAIEDPDGTGLFLITYTKRRIEWITTTATSLKTKLITLT